MAIDCGKSGPSKYRTEASNNMRQTCFFSQKKKDRVFDRFTSHNLDPGNRDSLIFKIELSYNNSVKEQHLPYNLSSFSKSNGDSRDNIDKKATSEEIFKKKMQKMKQMLKDGVIEMEQNQKETTISRFLKVQIKSKKV